MKIGINTLSVVPGGLGAAETYLFNIVHNLYRIEPTNEYYVFVSEANESHFRTDRPNVHLVLVPGPMRKRAWRVFAEQVHLPRLADRQELDVLFCPNEAVPVRAGCATVATVQNLLHFHFSRFYRRKVGTWAQWSRSWLQHAYYRAVMPRSLKSAQRVVTVSRHAASEIVERIGIDREKIVVVPYGVAPEFRPWSDARRREFRERNAWIPDRFILCLGGFMPYKNLDRLIDAFASMKKRRGGSEKLVLAGSDFLGLTDGLARRAAEAGIGSEVIFREYVPHGDVPGLYNVASCVAVLSSCESFGLPLVEAAACGTPVVASDRSSLPEVAGAFAQMVDPDDVEMCARALEKALDDPATIGRARTSGPAAASQLTWEIAAEKMARIFAEVANGRMR